MKEAGLLSKISAKEIAVLFQGHLLGMDYKNRVVLAVAV